MNQNTGLSQDNILHIRFYYKDDGDNDALRCDLNRVVDDNYAISIISVRKIHLLRSDEQGEKNVLDAMWGMQILSIDAVHFETELWIHYNREN